MEKHIGKLKIFYQDPKVVENYERKRKFKDDDVSLLHVSEIEGLKNIVNEAKGHILEIAVGTGRIARNLQSNASIYLGIDCFLKQGRQLILLQESHFLRGLMPSVYQQKERVLMQ